jgi:hypothetical protein
MATATPGTWNSLSTDATYASRSAGGADEGTCAETSVGAPATIAASHRVTLIR